MNNLLKTNDKIRAEISLFNNEFSYKLNGCLLSFTGSRIKGYSLYFKDTYSGAIFCTVSTGNERTILTAIQSIYQFSACRVPILKN